MKSSELRIGNWVKYGTGRDPVQITGKDLYDGVEGRPFFALPIDSSWLIKFGIGEEGLLLGSNFWYSGRHKKLYFEDEDGTISCLCDNLTTVHRLQNVIFSLYEIEK